MTQRRLATLLAIPLACFGTIGEARDLTKIAEIRFTGGHCDGSAAAQIDDQTILVANDETNVLHSFNIESGESRDSRKLGTMFELSSDEVDFEGATRNGDTIWWIGSHGRNGDADKQPNRRTLIATNVPTRDLEDLEKRSDVVDLTEAFKASQKLSDEMHDDVWKTAPKKGGFNIEGLSSTGNGHLIIGLRSPLERKKGLKGDAYVVELEDPGGTPKVKKVHELDLDNRGVRGIARRPGGGYRLIAGRVPSGGPFALMDWDENGDLKELFAPDLNTLNPEAILRVGTRWLVLSDDGSVFREASGESAEECKDIAKDHPNDERVYFRGILYSD